MAAVHLAAAVPLGFDSGLPGSDSEHLLMFGDMSGSHYPNMIHECDFVKSESPDEPLYSNPASDVGKSPGRQSVPQSPARASSSLSLRILTPASTSGYNGDEAGLGDCDDADGVSTSSRSNISPSSEGYGLACDLDEHLGGVHSVKNRPPLSLGSGVHSSSHHPRGSSMAPSVANYSHRHFCESTSSTGGWMDTSQPSQWASLHPGPSGPLNSTPATNVDFFDENLFDEFANFPVIGTAPDAPNLPFRSLSSATGEIERPSHKPFVSHAEPYARSIQRQPGVQAAGLTPMNSVGRSSVQHPFPSQREHICTPQQPHQTGLHPPQAQAQAPRPVPAPVQPHVPGQRTLAIPPCHQPGTQHHDVPSPAPVLQLLRRLEPVSSSLSRRAGALVQQTDRSRGGRKKNSHLAPPVRDKTSKMRKAGACWRCALQRDPVSSDPPCSSV